jgi:hypothetical protein
MLGLALLVAPAFAQEQGKGEGAPGMPDPKAMMDAYVKAAEPGEHHQHLNFFVGKWKLMCTSYCMGPEPTKDPGTATFRWVLGNRFLIQDVESTMMGMPFMGHGMTGYDTAKSKYTGIWCDNMGTGFMVSHGTCDSSGKNWTYEGEFDDPVTKTTNKYKQELKIINDKSFSFTMFGPGPDGKEMKLMEILYERS